MFTVSTLPTTEAFNKQKTIKTLRKFILASKAKQRRDKYDRKLNNQQQNQAAHFLNRFSLGLNLKCEFTKAVRTKQ